MYKTVDNFLPNIISLILIILLVWLFAAYFQKESTPTTSTISTKAKVTTPQKVSSSSVYKPVALFGEPEKTEKKPPKKKEPVKANLNIKLVGVFLGPKSVALIEKSGKTEVYKINDKILPDVELLEVEKDSVIVLHAGEEKFIELEKLTELDIKPITSNEANKTTLSPPSNFQSRTSFSLNEISSKFTQGTIDQQEILLNQPIALEDVFISTPVEENGVMIGFKVNPQKNKATLDYLQLNPNDVVTEINGVAATEFADMEDLQGLINGGSSVIIRLIRNGKEEELAIALPY
jgi:general secretion pathway protein C